MNKKRYSAPRIEWIKLDSDISLALESNPPLGPDETNNNLIPAYFNTIPTNPTLG